MYHAEAVRADNSPANPAQSMTLGAAYLVLWNPSLCKPQIKVAPVLLTAEIDLTGAGGRDQTAAFAIGQTIWFYWIWGDDTSAPLDTIVSANAPPVGPTLPAAYTSFCPAFPMIVADDGSIELKPVVGSSSRTVTRIRGRKAFYANAIVKDYSNAIGLSATLIDLSTVVPAGASLVSIEVDAELHNGGAQLIAGFVTEWESGQNDLNVSLYEPVANFVTAGDVVHDVPVNDDRKMWAMYRLSAGAITSSDCCIIVRGYSW